MTYYDDLGVTPDATQATIKAAYRKLAGENHPDHAAHKGGSEEKFKAAATAYAVLGDALARARYDKGQQSADERARALEGAARNELLNVFAQLVAQVDENGIATADFKAALLNAITQGQFNSRSQKYALMAELRKYRRIKRRIKGGEEFFIGWIDQQRLKKLRDLKQQQFLCRVGDKMKAMAETFAYDFIAAQKVYFPPSGSGWSQTFTS